MVIALWGQAAPNMRYHQLTRLLSRNLTFWTLLLVLFLTLIVTQHYISLDLFPTWRPPRHGQALPGLPNDEVERAYHSYQVTRQPELQPRQSLPPNSYSDARYKGLRSYHDKGLALRARFDCAKLFEGDEIEQQKVVQFHNQNGHNYSVIDPDDARSMTDDCKAFRAIRRYKTSPGTSVERDFPLAYIILAHRDFEHLERLLRMIYRPQHSICLHLDKKAPESLKAAVAGLARCFPNVVLASDPQEIIYAHMSRLKADLVCMEDLLKLDKSWKYLINYAATEFPLRTNLETVKILQLLRGRNDIHEQFGRRLEGRFKKAYDVVDGHMKQSNRALPPPPFNITIVKGQAYNTYSRQFIEWVIHDERPRQFLAWSSETFSPDEHYWASLNDLYHNPFLESPGGFKGHPDKKGYITRFISWQYSNPRFKCQGRSVHNICNFSALDLPILLNEMHLAANKFDLTFDPVAYACMEELIENRTSAQLPFSLRDYTKLYFINYKS